MLSSRIISVFPPKLKTATRALLGIRVKNVGALVQAIKDRTGLEIGGPSSVFGDSGILPLYRYARRIDNCVFAVETYWEQKRDEGQTFFYHPRRDRGFNFIREAADVSGIADQSYDFLLASHVLEHTANPIKTLKEWRRVVRPRAPLIVILPHHRHTFDRNRAVTSIQHMLEDFSRGMDESDLSHVQEILNLQEFTPTEKVPDREHFRAILYDNKRIRLMHHHVFDEKNSVALLEASGLIVTNTQFVRPHHIVLISEAS